MAAPTNVSAATAIDIGTLLPYSTTQNVHDSGTTYDVFYSYTAQASDTMIGVFGYGTIGSGYQPSTSILDGPAGAPTPYLITSADPNKCVQFPVTPGDTYFFKFATSAGNPSPAVLTLSVVKHTNLVAPAGSIGVNDETDGFPLALIDVDNPAVTVLRFVQDIVAGEQAATLNNGIVALEERAAATTIRTAIYDTDYNEIGSVTGYGDALTSNRVDTFYAAGVTAGPTWKVKKFTADGTVSFTTSALASAVSAIGVSPDETILYYFSVAGTTTIRRWDMVNDIALTNLATINGSPPKDMIVLGDGRIVIGDSIHDTLVIFNTDGTIDDTLTLTRLNVSDRICRDLTSASVWVWNKIPITDTEDFLQIYVTTGATLKTLNGPQFVDGVYFTDPATETPVARFGNANSCPFWITPVASITPPDSELNGPGGLAILRSRGRLIDSPIRRVRRAPILFNENKRIQLQRFELFCTTGSATVTGQGSAPVVLFNLSKDAAQTWFLHRTLNTGALGEYMYRCYTHQLGMGRQFVAEVVQTDPVETVWTGAAIEPNEGLN